MLKKFLKKSYLLIGLAIFVWVMKDINFAELVKIIPNINIWYYILALVLYLPVALLKSYRWKKILEIQGIVYSFKDAFYIYNSSLLLGLVTPGRIGDASKVLYLKKDNRSFGQAVFGVLFDKVSDLVFVALFLAITFPFLPLVPRLAVNYPALFQFSLLVGGSAIILFSFVYFKKNSRLRQLTLRTIEELKKFKIKDDLYLLILTAFTWFIYFFMIYLIAVSVGINSQIGFFYLAFSAALITLAALLPISVLGIGTREAALLFFLLPLGLNKETIVLFSLLITFNYLGLFLICFYAWFKKPMV
ncbi:MAG: lysylphosphatidylglycerol synthase transmembrane domain-containing protein [Candidatus Portnoybacteria bacterium]|nr:lysylphosphatidylglycerol synthase transmembrane domain-containing protein [Candidatus Portnoybacteria bacterium]MDD4982466.1 lysylphosphatidylglycerol synthase transmembrane domain-containing protein [Candidatus Portnoybacteria bacterium]